MSKRPVWIPEEAGTGDIAEADDGSICREWETARGCVWADTQPSGWILIYQKIDGQRLERHFNGDCAELSQHIAQAFAKLYGNSQDHFSKAQHHE